LVDGLVQGSAWQFGSGQRNVTYSLSLNDNPNGGSWTTEFQPIQSDWLTPGGATLAALLNLGASSMPSVDFMQMNIA
jgi:hypothetical protein